MASHIIRDRFKLRYRDFSLCILLVLHSTFSIAEPESKDPFFQVLLDYALIADVTYKNTLTIKKTLLSQGYTLDEYNRLPGFGVTYLIASNDTTKEQIIAVRGTSNIENAVVDAGFILIRDDKTGIDLHQGFALSARDIYGKLADKLKTDYRISTTGHSLGGAVAVIVAMYLDVDGYNVDKIITFGQPKVTNISGSKQFQHLPLYRVVMPRDMVPLIPPTDPMDMMNLSIFWHIGTEIILLKGRKYAELNGVKSMMRAVEFLDDMPGVDHLQQHFMTSYLDRLREKQFAPQKVTYEIKLNFSDWLTPEDK